MPRTPVKTSKEKPDRYRRKALKKAFEQAIHKVGQIDYFRLCIHKRVMTDCSFRSMFMKESRAWTKEADENWGFSRTWEPEQGCIVPENAPPPVYRGFGKKASGDPAGQSAPIPDEVKNSDDLPDVKAATGADFSSQVRWAQEMLGHNPDLIPARQIPSRAHLQMLKFAVSDPERFYRWVLDLDAKREETEKGKKSFEDDMRRHFKLFDLIIADLERREARETSKISTPVAANVVVS